MRENGSAKERSVTDNQLEICEQHERTSASGNIVGEFARPRERQTRSDREVGGSFFRVAGAGKRRWYKDGLRQLRGRGGWLAGAGGGGGLVFGFVATFVRMVQRR